eukprot:9117604-Lingulodinium_polyedra.AAC.1
MGHGSSREMRLAEHQGCVGRRFPEAVADDFERYIVAQNSWRQRLDMRWGVAPGLLDQLGVSRPRERAPHCDAVAWPRH